MSDKFFQMFEGGRKASEDKGGPFFAIAPDSIIRLDLRHSDGLRVSLPYHQLHEVQYVPGFGDTIEEIRLHYPGYSAVRMTGRQLLSIYEAFLDHRVQWVRQRGKDEAVPGGETAIDVIDYYNLTDWEIDYTAREERRAEWLGERNNSKDEPSRTET